MASCTKKPDNDNKNNTSTTVETQKEEVKELNGDELLNTLRVSLISEEVSKYKYMYFSDYIQSSLEPTDDGTAMTLLLHSDDPTITTKNIKSITMKTIEGTAVNMSTKTYNLNNGKGCIIFAKTEGKHQPDEYSVLVKTVNDKEKLIPVPNTKTPEIIKDHITPAGQARFGDLITIKDRTYFILQSGSLSSTVYDYEDKKYAKVVLGTTLIPLDNKFVHELKHDDFIPKFFDVMEYGNYNVETDLSINDSEMLETHKEVYKGLFAELITCTFVLEVRKEADTSETVARRDYVMSNTWIQGTYDPEFLYKLYYQPNE
jgi:hypothetical protein